jgi:hypothetical protein
VLKSTAFSSSSVLAPGAAGQQKMIVLETDEEERDEAEEAWYPKEADVKKEWPEFSSDHLWASKTLSPEGYLFVRAEYDPAGTKMYILSRSTKNNSTWCL